MRQHLNDLFFTPKNSVKIREFKCEGTKESCSLSSCLTSRASKCPLFIWMRSFSIGVFRDQEEDQKRHMVYDDCDRVQDRDYSRHWLHLVKSLLTKPRANIKPVL